MLIFSHMLCTNPLVSIIVPTYNQENLLSETIDSILKQECKFEYEIIIGEDCSTDNTKKICIKYQQQYPSCIRLLLQESNQGIIKNFANLINLCRGKYIAHCAGDDYWCDKYKLQKQVKFLKKNPDYGFVRTGFYYQYPKKKIVIGTGHSNVEGNVFDTAKYGPVAAAATILFKSELVKYLDFDEFIKRRFSIEDYPMQAILAKYTKFGYIPDYTAVFRQTIDSGSRPASREKKLFYYQGYINVKLYLAELFPEDIDCNETIANNYMIKKRINFAIEDFNYMQAKDLAAKFVNPNKIEARIYKITSNSFLFYIFCIFKRVKKIL